MARQQDQQDDDRTDDQDDQDDQDDSRTTSSRTTAGQARSRPTTTAGQPAGRLARSRPPAGRQTAGTLETGRTGGWHSKRVIETNV